MKKYLLSFLLAFICISIKAQNDEITLVVNGEGQTKEEATKIALRNAIDQSFGTFVSANTTILNDELIKDEIITVSSGNIKQYKEISTVSLPDGNVSITLSATVSIGKLIQYAKAHGSTAEFSGQAFLMEMKMQSLNAENEKKTLEHLLAETKEISSTFYDCDLEVDSPHITKAAMVQGDSKYLTNLSYDGSDLSPEEGYSVPIRVVIKTNNNFNIWEEHFTSVLSQLALSEVEIKNADMKNVRTSSFSYRNRKFILRTKQEFLHDFAEQLADILNNYLYRWRIVEEGTGNEYGPHYQYELDKFDAGKRIIKRRVSRRNNVLLIEEVLNRQESFMMGSRSFNAPHYCGFSVELINGNMLYISSPIRSATQPEDLMAWRFRKSVSRDFNDNPIFGPCSVEVFGKEYDDIKNELKRIPIDELKQIPEDLIPDRIKNYALKGYICKIPIELFYSDKQIQSVRGYEVQWSIVQDKETDIIQQGSSVLKEYLITPKELESSTVETSYFANLDSGNGSDWESLHSSIHFDTKASTIVCDFIENGGKYSILEYGDWEEEDNNGWKRVLIDCQNAKGNDITIKLRKKGTDRQFYILPISDRLRSFCLQIQKPVAGAQTNSGSSSLSASSLPAIPGLPPTHTYSDEEIQGIKEEALSFALVEQKPSFDGGDVNVMLIWVQNQIPIEIQEAYRGRQTFSIWISDEGYIADVELSRGTITDKEIISKICNLFRAYKQVIPGQQRGENVAVCYVMPLIFNP